MGFGFGSINPNMISQLRISPQILSQITPSMLSLDRTDAAAPRCRCMLDAIPGLAQDQAMYSQGLQVCLQNPNAFAQQVASAGITATCDGDGSAATPWYRTTPGMLGIGLGAVAVLGLGAWAVSK